MDKRFPIADQIEMLGSALRGRLVTPQSAEYDQMRLGATANSDSKPAAIIRVANAADVAAVINFARATDLSIGVRSGGHGGHGADGALLIDLRDLTGIEIDAAACTAWAGTGLTAGDVTAAVQQHGMIIGFGDSGSVGIGGLTLGGGIGYLVRKHGLTLDHLLAVEVVTATGDVLVADETHHPELFWALRGGGGNFAVVTRMKYRLHPLPHFTGGPLILPATPEVLVAFAAAAEAAPEELSTIALLMPAPPMPFVPAELHGKIVLMGMMAFAGEPEAAQRALAPFRAIATPIADLVGPAPFSSMYLPEDPTMRPRIAMRTGLVDRFDTADARHFIERIEAGDAPMRIAQFRVLGGAFGRVPAGATAFAHRNRKVLVAFLALYGDPADAAHHDSWVAGSMARLPSRQDDVYVNFLAENEGDVRVRAAYPGGTWDRLRQVKRRYDPENLFHLNWNIPPAA